MMKHGFGKGLAVGAALGLMLAGTSVYAATKYVQAELVSASVKASGKTVGQQEALKYKGSYYLNLKAIESALHTSGVKYSWAEPVLSVGVASKTKAASSSHSKATGITFSNMVCKDDGMGDAEVDGIATNNDSTTHTATLVVAFFDAHGKLLGTGEGAIDSLGSGKSITFTTMSDVSVSKVKSFKVQVDSLM